VQFVQPIRFGHEFLEDERRSGNPPELDEKRAELMKTNPGLKICELLSNLDCCQRIVVIHLASIGKAPKWGDRPSPTI